MKSITMNVCGTNEIALEDDKTFGRIRCISGYVNVEDIVQLSNDPNVRDANPKAQVVLDIEDTLHFKPKKMALLSKGVVFTARNAMLDKKHSKGSFVVDVMDGLIDGGHNQLAIKNALSKGYNIREARIPFKALVGEQLSDAEITVISRSLNKNSSPSEATLADREGLTKNLKIALEEYAKYIEWRENSKSVEGKKRQDYMPLSNFLHILNFFNLDYSYCGNEKGAFFIKSSPAEVTKKFSHKKVDFVYLTPIMKDIVRLYDEIILSFTRNMGTCKRRTIEDIQILCNSSDYKYISNCVDFDLIKSKTTLFTNQDYLFTLGDQYLYVIMNAMRACIQIKDDKVQWVVPDILKFFRKIERNIWNELIETAKKKSNGGADGGICNLHLLMKDSSLYKSVYYVVERAVYEERLNNK